MSIPAAFIAGGLFALLTWWLGGNHNLQVCAGLVANATVLAGWEVLS